MANNINGGIPKNVPIVFGHNTTPLFLDAMADAFGLKTSIPLVGDKDGGGRWQFGQVSNARVAGDRLIADLVHVPIKLAEVISAKGIGYTSVSPSIGQFAAKVVKRWFGDKGKVVRGPVMLNLALLGAEQPAFTTQDGLENAVVMSAHEPEEMEIFSMAGSSLWEDFIQVEGEENMPEEMPAATPLPGFLQPEWLLEQYKGTPAAPQSLHATGTMNIVENCDSPMEGGSQTGMQIMPNADAPLQGGPKVGMQIDLQAQTLDVIKSLAASVARLNERMEGWESQSFQSKLVENSRSWKHLFASDEEYQSELTAITELNAKSPEGAQAVIERWNLFATMSPVAQKQQAAPPRVDPQLFRRQSTGISPSESAPPVPGISEMQGDELDEMIKMYAREHNLDPDNQYDEAYGRLMSSSREAKDLYFNMAANCERA